MKSLSNSDRMHITHTTKTNKNYESDSEIADVHVNILPINRTEFILNWERQVTYWYENSDPE